MTGDSSLNVDHMQRHNVGSRWIGTFRSARLSCLAAVHPGDNNVECDPLRRGDREREWEWETWTYNNLDNLHNAVIACCREQR